MGDLDFYRASTPLSLERLVAEARVPMPEGVDANHVFHFAASLNRAGPGHVAFHFDFIGIDDLATTRAGACFVTAQNQSMVPARTIALVTDSLLDAFRRVAGLMVSGESAPFSQALDRGPLVSTEANLEVGAAIGFGTVVGPRVEIGTGTTIGANGVIGAGVRIGRDCVIDPHVSIRNALIGDRVRIGAGARIGPEASRMAQLGRVIIQNDVEIQANAVIAPGLIGDTMIGDGAQIGALTLLKGPTTIDRGHVIKAYTGS